MKIIILRAVVQSWKFTDVYLYIGGETGKLINVGFPQCKTIIMLLIFQSPVPLFLCSSVSCCRRCLRSAKRCCDVLSAPRFLVDVFSFVVHAEFEVGVLSPEEFRWKIFLSEDLEALVLLVSFAWDIVPDSLMVNIVSQTINKHNKMRLGHRRQSLCCLEMQNALSLQSWWTGSLRGQDLCPRTRIGLT